MTWPRARSRCVTSAQSNRSRSITNDLDQISSSIGDSLTGMPKSGTSAAKRNQSVSTRATPLPLEKMRSIASSAFLAFASQCGNGTLVSNPASRSARKVRSRSSAATNRSRSFVGRTTPVYWVKANVPPTRNWTPRSCKVRSAIAHAASCAFPAVNDPDSIMVGPKEARTVPEMADTQTRPDATLRRLRVAAMGDMHVGRTASPGVAQAFARVREVADVLVLCGDLTDRGTEDEAQQLGRDLKAVGIPVVAVLGNHDYE